MRVLVTGARGFVGRHLTTVLGTQAEVATLSGDVRDPMTFGTLARADVAYHLAALTTVPESVADPRQTWEVNADGTLRVLEWARHTDLGRLVILSSAHVYGRVKRSPIDESHPLEPVSPYGASKAAAEMAASAYRASYGLDIVVLRPFNIYGPGQGPGYLIPDVLGQLREGKDLLLGDPRPVRDFTYVSDAIDLLVRAGKTRGLAGRTFNLGSGEGHSVAAVVDLALKVTGSPLRPRYDENRVRNDLQELIVDNRAAREALGWAPRVGLADGLRRTWEAMTVA